MRRGNRAGSAIQLDEGNVVLTQGENAISGQQLAIDLNAGTGKISGGRVKSVFTPSSTDENATE